MMPPKARQRGTEMLLLSGIIAIGGWFAFLGFMLGWVKAVPLIIIVAIVTALMMYDWVMTVRYGDKWESR
jgi:Flp pilus assembly protein TadB